MNTVMAEAEMCALRIYQTQLKMVNCHPAWRLKYEEQLVQHQNRFSDLLEILNATNTTADVGFHDLPFGGFGVHI